MWKTAKSEAAKCHLCPSCDSLGPHLSWEDEETYETWLECIDCGMRLGRLTPGGLKPLATAAG